MKREMEEKYKLVKRIVDLECSNERRNRIDKKNKTVIKIVNWKMERLEQTVKEFIKENLTIGINIKKASRLNKIE